jgi:hypothetical protein
VFAAVNRVYVFYDSWNELLGHERRGGLRPYVSHQKA